MGYIRNDLLFVHFDSEYQEGGKEVAVALETLRSEMPEPFKSLLIGPVHPAANGGEHWLFLPDGSKEGWETSAEGDRWRQRFIECFAPLGYTTAIRVQWGDDDPVLTTGRNALREPATTGWH